MTPYARIAHTATFCGSFLMLFDRGDVAREAELHQAARSLSLVARTVADIGNRYGAVLIQQPEPQGELL